MKIASSQISLASEYSKKHSIVEKEEMQKWSRPQDAPQNIRQNLDRLELSQEYNKLEEGAEVPPELMKMLRAIEAMTGKKIDIASFKELTPKNVEQNGVGWGISYNYEKTEIKEENLVFSAKGKVVSEDGKKIDFSFAFAMQNKTELHESVSFKAGDALIDPLVINFGSENIGIGKVKHTFDLDLDGVSDTFSFVGSGSGFLALDKNNDRKINNGSELFGPTLGNGFKELQAYDEDKNFWIDENDSIYNDLLIWTKDEDGEERLFGLKEKNIGAIYLQPQETTFDLGAAKLKESSIYLSESGKVRSISEIDLVV